ncbi:MAG: hypothetical protein FD167_2368, partial [bacterium]
MIPENNKGWSNQPREAESAQSEITQNKLSFYISEFSSKMDNQPKKVQITWGNFLSLIKRPVIRASKDGKAFAPATFNGNRSKENAQETFLLVLDCDDGTPLEESMTKCKNLGYSFAIYTTFSHTQEKHKFRVVFLLATPIPANNYPQLWQWIAKQFPNIDPAPKSTASIFYYPAIKTKDSPFYAESFGGKLLDWTKLPLVAIAEEPPKQQYQQTSYNHTLTNKAKAAYVQAALDDEVAKVRNAVEGERNDTVNKAAFALAQLLHTNLIDEITINTELESAGLASGLPISEVRATIKNGIAAGRKQSRIIPEKEFSSSYQRPNNQQTSPKHDPSLEDPGTPFPYDLGSQEGQQSEPLTIRTDTQLSEIFDQTRDAFIKANNPVRFFRRNGKIVWINYDDGGIKLEPVNENIMHSTLARIIVWIKVNKDGNIKNCKPPREATIDLLVNVDNRLPEIESIITTPIFIDGELISTPGYHPKHKIYYQPPNDFSLLPISQNPSKEEINKAKNLLINELFCDFPFCSDGDPSGQAELANTIAAMLLPFIRREIKGKTPLHLVEAPVQGSGKSLLASIIGTITTGKEPAMRTFPSEESEVRKAITSELLRGTQTIIFDNITGVLKSDSLASALTSDEWSDRLLGINQTVSLKNRVLWLATANNCTLGQDFPRRTVRIRLDPRDEHPWLRTGFKQEDIVNWVKNHRSTIIHAILTIIQSWVAVGQPKGSKTLGSFEQWAKIISGILENADIPGFLENINEVYKAFESQNENWYEFVECWFDKFGTNPKRVNDLNELCQQLNLMVNVRGDNLAGQSYKLGRALAKNR